MITSPYYRLNSRKFTLIPTGGFDGWDIYREYRTNGDRFILGNSGYLKGAATSIRFPTATGWGAFKTIVGPDKQDWGNTDYYAYLWGQSTFVNPEAVNINVFTTPGVDYVTTQILVEEAIDILKPIERIQSIFVQLLIINMFVNTTSDFTGNFIYPQESTENLEDTGIDSNYTATYYPWILTRDTVNNTQVIPTTNRRGC